MWRALVLAVGISLCLLGGEFMVVDRLFLAANNSVSQRPYSESAYSAAPTYRAGSYSSLGTPTDRVFVPPEWAPWGALSVGVLTVLYASAMPRE